MVINRITSNQCKLKDAPMKGVVLTLKNSDDAPFLVVGVEDSDRFRVLFLEDSTTCCLHGTIVVNVWPGSELTLKP